MDPSKDRQNDSTTADTSDKAKTAEKSVFMPTMMFSIFSLGALHSSFSKSSEIQYPIATFKGRLFRMFTLSSSAFLAIMAHNVCTRTGMFSPEVLRKRNQWIKAYLDWEKETFGEFYDQFTKELEIKQEKFDRFMMPNKREEDDLDQNELRKGIRKWLNGQNENMKSKTDSSDKSK